MAGAQGIRAGKAYVEIGVDLSKLRQGLNTAAARLKSFGSSMNALGQSFLGGGVAIATPLAIATKIFADFDDAMRTVKARTQATGAEFEALTEQAKELGRTTSFTAAQVANAMVELASKGFTTGQIQATVPAVLDLSRSTANEGGLQEASAILASTLQQFGLSAEQSVEVADKLSYATNNSANTLTTLGEALSYSGKTAKEMGVSLDDSLAIIAKLGDVGLQGSRAGAAFNNILSRISGQRDAIKEAFGVEIFDASDNLRPIVDVLSDIDKAASNMGSGVRGEAFDRIFGLRSLIPAQVIGQLQLGIQQFSNQIGQSANYANKVAKEMDSGVGGSFRMILSAAEGAAIAIGAALAPAVQQLGNVLINALTQLTAFVNENRAVIVSVGLAATGMIALGGVLIGTGLAFSAVGVAVGGFASALAFLQAVLSATIAKTVALAVAMGLAKIAGAAAATGMVAWQLAVIGAQTATALFALVLGTVRGLYLAMTTATGLASAAQLAWTTITSAASIAQGIFAAATTGAAAALGALEVALAAVGGPMVLVVVGVLAASAALLYFTGLAGEAVDFLKGAFGTLLADVSLAFDGIADALKGGNIILAAKILWAAVKLEWARGVAFVSDIWQVLKAVGLTLFTELKYAVIERINELSSALSSIWIDMTAGLSAVFNNFATPFLEKWYTIQGEIEKIILRIMSLWESALDLDAENVKIDQEVQQRITALRQSNDAKNAAYNDQKTASEEIFQQEKANNAEAKAQELKLIEDNRNAAISGQEARVSQLADDLKKLREEAAQPAEAAVPGDGGFNFSNLQGREVPNQDPITEPALTENLTRAISGTLSGFGASALGFTAEADKNEQVANNTKAMVEEQKKTNRLLEESDGLTFDA